MWYSVCTSKIVSISLTCVIKGKGDTFLWYHLNSHKEPLCRNTVTLVVVVQSINHFWLLATTWTATHQAPLSSTIFWSLLKFISTELVMLFTHLILCSPLLSPLVFPSIRIFSSQPALLIRWPMCCRFSFSISPSNEYSGLISFRIYSFDLLAVQGTLKRFL